MTDNPYIQAMVNRLNTVSEDIVFFIDEQGVAGVDELYIMGGIIAYRDIAVFESAWTDFLTENNLKHKKGKKFSEQDLLNVNSFLIGKPIFPVATYFKLSKEELNEVRSFSRLYEKSSYPGKKFKKISAGSWLRKAHMTEVLGTGIAGFTNHVGGIKHASINYDRISDTPGMKEHIEALLYRNTSGVVFEENLLLTSEMAAILNRTQPSSWKIDLEAKGLLLDLADIICTMFGHYAKGTMPAPWDLLVLEHRINELLTPPALGRDVTEAVQRWLSRLYEQRQLLEAHCKKC